MNIYFTSGTNVVAMKKKKQKTIVFLGNHADFCSIHLASSLDQKELLRQFLFS